jgi:hypothetical protein
VYPAQWTELSPGSFTYSYKLNSTARKSIHLAIGSTAVGQLNISNIQSTPTMFDVLSAPAQLLAGQPLSLQLNSSAASFASLAASSTGWRVQLVRPNNSSADLGLMADWATSAVGVYQGNITVPGSYLTQVG